MGSGWKSQIWSAWTLSTSSESSDYRDHSFLELEFSVIQKHLPTQLDWLFWKQCVRGWKQAKRHWWWWGRKAVLLECAIGRPLKCHAQNQLLSLQRYERLEDQLHDLTDLHQHETANLKQELASIEEKVAYQAYERARDIQVPFFSWLDTHSGSYQPFIHLTNLSVLPVSPKGFLAYGAKHFLCTAFLLHITTPFTHVTESLSKEAVLSLYFLPKVVKKYSLPTHSHHLYTLPSPSSPEFFKNLKHGQTLPSVSLLPGWGVKSSSAAKQLKTTRTRAELYDVDCESHSIQTCGAQQAVNWVNSWSFGGQTLDFSPRPAICQLSDPEQTFSLFAHL